MKLQPFPRAKEPTIAEIIGVVPDIRHFGLRESVGPAVYFPITQMDPPWAPSFEVRYSRDLTTASREIEQTVAQLDPRLHALDIQTLDQQINAYLEKERMLATVASLFGAIALLLAAVGLYGVMAYAVTRRTKEIGLRMALGARRSEVLDMILKDGAAVAFAGVALGVPAAVALSRLLSSLAVRSEAERCGIAGCAGCDHAGCGGTRCVGTSVARDAGGSDGRSARRVTTANRNTTPRRECVIHQLRTARTSSCNRRGCD